MDAILDTSISRTLSVVQVDGLCSKAEGPPFPLQSTLRHCIKSTLKVGVKDSPNLVLELHSEKILNARYTDR